MKKLFIICAAVFLVVSFAACAGEDAPGDSLNSVVLRAESADQDDMATNPGDHSEQSGLDVYIKTEGTWFLNGDAEAGFLLMDGVGGYELYGSEGVSLSSGQLHYTAENDKFMMQADDMDDTQYDTFYFEDDTRIVFEGSGSLYLKDVM